MGASKVDGKIYGENSKFYGLKMFEKRMGGNMMNDTLVQSFLSVAAEGSFCKAAEKIYISQPNLSRNIARLEKELNVQLFDRSGKHIALPERYLESMMVRYFLMAHSCRPLRNLMDGRF